MAFRHAGDKAQIINYQEALREERERETAGGTRRKKKWQFIFNTSLEALSPARCEIRLI